jgi:quercetin dioxygenase-like cupin family protein
MPSRAARRTLVIIAVLALGIFGATTAPAVLRIALDAPQREILAEVRNPQGATGRTLVLQRVEIPANTPLAAHTHRGTQIAAIETGALRYTVIAGRPVRVVRPVPEGEPKLVRLIKPGETFTVRAGLSVIEPAGTAHSVRSGNKKVVIYVSSLLRNGAPLSDPYPPGSGR